ncbi:DUF3293 domain-containing protein [Aestuariivirga sp.]|jgi:hypothetical protein|uniref:DUF3293 domain-containing protein n=1 Tax=Aestuariivirga sp. TaxID=2650926 RepID=UPI0037840C00
MAQTEIPIDKIEAYLDTYYRVGVGPDAFVLQVGQHSPALALLYKQNGCDCAVFITAFNPFGRKQVDSANEDAHERLREQLDGPSNRVIEGVGADPTEKWKEKSYLAFGLDADTARELGRRFRQDAVVWIGSDAVPQLLLLR